MSFSATNISYDCESRLLDGPSCSLCALQPFHATAAVVSFLGPFGIFLTINTIAAKQAAMNAG